MSLRAAQARELNLMSTLEKKKSSCPLLQIFTEKNPGSSVNVFRLAHNVKSWDLILYMQNSLKPQNSRVFQHLHCPTQKNAPCDLLWESPHFLIP